MLPDMKAYQSNRRRMAWAALAMMIVSTTAVIIDPARMAQADAVLMMMYGSLSALVGAYFGFANSGDSDTARAALCGTMMTHASVDPHSGS
jgi:hypothetical protein